MSKIPSMITPSRFALPAPPIPPVNSNATIASFFEHRSFRRLIAILGIGSAVALAFSAFRKHLFRVSSTTSNSSTSGIVVSTVTSEEKKIVTSVEEEKPEEPVATASDPSALVVNVSEIEEVSVPKTVSPEILKPEAEDQNKNPITLYQVPRGFFTPAVSPFGLKLETFLRVAKLQYEPIILTSLNSNDSTDMPWIRLKDEEIKDNLRCIQIISEKFNINLGAGATESRKTAARLVETLFGSKILWGIELWRWVFDEGKSMKAILPLSPKSDHVLTGIKDAVTRAAYYHGLGRKSQDEVVTIVKQALSDAVAALGRHAYFLGPSPGEVDCDAFSLLAQMVWNMPGSPFEKAIKEQKSLMDYVLRMKENFWPDWDTLLQNSPPIVDIAVTPIIQQQSEFTSQVTNNDVPLSTSSPQKEEGQKESLPQPEQLGKDVKISEQKEEENVKLSEQNEEQEVQSSEQKVEKEVKSSEQKEGENIKISEQKEEKEVKSSDEKEGSKKSQIKLQGTLSYIPLTPSVTTPFLPTLSEAPVQHPKYAQPGNVAHPTQAYQNYNNTMPKQFRSDINATKEVIFSQQIHYLPPYKQQRPVTPAYYNPPQVQQLQFAQNPARVFNKNYQAPRYSGPTERRQSYPKPNQYPAPAPAQTYNVVRDNAYYDDLQRATAAVMRGRMMDHTNTNYPSTTNEDQKFLNATGTSLYRPTGENEATYETHRQQSQNFGGFYK